MSFIQTSGLSSGDNMEVVVLGNKGMLGHMVEKFLKGRIGTRVTGFGRETLDLSPNSFPTIATKLTRHVGLNKDYVINCIGAIKPHFNNKSAIATNIFTNGIFPHYLAQWGQETNTKVIHITTDCVFDGSTGKYTELSPHNALDAYGKSKSVGEPENCMVIRTSIIGPENGTKKSLVEWVKQQDGKRVSGFTNHYWNGVTTLQLAKALYSIMTDDTYTLGTHHVFASNDVTKLHLVKTIAEYYRVSVEVTPAEVEYCDRTLRTVKALNHTLSIPSVEWMIKEMADVKEG
jgi:dTDP-4-dehydrorhamnose reductase